MSISMLGEFSTEQIVRELFLRDDYEMVLGELKTKEIVKELLKRDDLDKSYYDDMLYGFCVDDIVEMSKGIVQSYRMKSPGWEERMLDVIHEMANKLVVK